MKIQKAISHLRGSTSPVSKISHSLQETLSSWYLLPAIPVINLYSLELTILFQANCCPLADAFLDLQASWAHKPTSSLAHMQNLVIPSSRIVAAQHDTASGPLDDTALKFWLCISAVGHRKGSADPFSLTSYFHLCKGWLQSRNWGRSWIKWCQGKRQHRETNTVIEVCPWKADSCEALLCSWSTSKQRGCSAILSVLRPISTPLQNNTKIEPLTVTETWFAGDFQVYTLPLWLQQSIADNLIQHTEPPWQMLIFKNANHLGDG